MAKRKQDAGREANVRQRMEALVAKGRPIDKKQLTRKERAALKAAQAKYGYRGTATGASSAISKRPPSKPTLPGVEPVIVTRVPQPTLPPAPLPPGVIENMIGARGGRPMLPFSPASAGLGGPSEWARMPPRGAPGTSGAPFVEEDLQDVQFRKFAEEARARNEAAVAEDVRKNTARMSPREVGRAMRGKRAQLKELRGHFDATVLQQLTSPVGGRPGLPFYPQPEPEVPTGIPPGETAEDIAAAGSRAAGTTARLQQRSARTSRAQDLKGNVFKPYEKTGLDSPSKVNKFFQRAGLIGKGEQIEGSVAAHLAEKFKAQMAEGGAIAKGSAKVKDVLKSLVAGLRAEAGGKTGAAAMNAAAKSFLGIAAEVAPSALSRAGKFLGGPAGVGASIVGGLVADRVMSGRERATDLRTMPQPTAHDVFTDALIADLSQRAAARQQASSNLSSASIAQMIQPVPGAAPTMVGGGASQGYPG